MGNAFNSNYRIPKMDADDGDQIEVSAVGRCGYFGYFAIGGCFFAIGGYFFASGGYFLPGSAMDMFLLVLYAGGGLGVFRQVEGELLVVVRRAS